MHFIVGVVVGFVLGVGAVIAVELVLRSWVRMGEDDGYGSR